MPMLLGSLDENHHNVLPMLVHEHYYKAEKWYHPMKQLKGSTDYRQNMVVMPSKFTKLSRYFIKMSG